MLTYPDLNPGKKAFIFELDGVLYPERDFYLQIYYLFAHFIEYVETVPPANELIQFMKTAYEHHGPDGIFDRAVDAFGLDQKYRENLERLESTAQFPLKLELHPPLQNLLQELVEENKLLFICTSGHPETQLNKLRQLNWKGLGKHLKVYFSDEFSDVQHALQQIMIENQLLSQEVLLIGAEFETHAVYLEIDFIHHSNFLPQPPV